MVVELLAFLPLMVVTALVSVLVSATTTPLFARLARLDEKTAFFSLLPGGIAEMGNIGQTVGARMEPIALVHTFRVALTVLVVPALLVSFADLTPVSARPDLAPLAVAFLLAAALLGTRAAYAVGLNNPWMIGALLVSATLSTGGLVDGRMPPALFAGGRFCLATTSAAGSSAIPSLGCLASRSSAL